MGSEDGALSGLAELVKPPKDEYFFMHDGHMCLQFRILKF